MLDLGIRKVGRIMIWGYAHEATFDMGSTQVPKGWGELIYGIDVGLFLGHNGNEPFLCHL
jgi:hypothetical protein